MIYITSSTVDSSNSTIFQSDNSTISIEPLVATENKTYTAPANTAYSPVTVNVPTGITPTGNIELTQKTGTDVSSKATASVRGAALSVNTPTITSGGLITASTALSTSGWIDTAPSSKTHQLSSSDNSNFVASNIKSGVEIFGITGTYTGGSTPPSGDIQLTKQSGTDVTNYATASVRSGALSLNVPTVSASGLITSTATLSTSGWVGSAPTNQTHQLSSSDDADFVAGNIKKGVTIFGLTGTYTGSGGGGGNVGTAVITPGSNVTTINFSNLLGEPTWFIFTPNEDINGSTSQRRIISHIYTPDNEFGFYIFGSGSWFSPTYTATRSTSYSHTYSNGTLTLNSGGADAGGYYYDTSSTLIYGY